MIQIVTGKRLDYTKPVRVYRNLNKPGVVYSVQQGGVVVAYATSITLTNCTCVVREKARQRVIANKRREVHAWVEGTIYQVGELVSGPAVSYNPYKYSFFYDVKTCLPVQSAKLMTFSYIVFFHQIPTSYA